MLDLQSETKKLLSPLPGGIYSTDILVISENSDSTFRAHVRTDDGASQSYSAAYELWQRFPDRKRLQFGSWEIGIEYAARVIPHIWPQGQLEFSSLEAKMQFYAAIAREKVYEQCAKRCADYKQDRHAPSHKYSLADNGLTLNEYQQVVLCNSMDSDGYNFFGEMGTGKTPTSIAVICNDIAKRRNNVTIGGRGKAAYREKLPLHISLVVCPNSVRTNWKVEINRFSTEKLHVEIIDGTARGREKAFINGLVGAQQEKCNGVVFIIGWDTLSVTFEAMQLFKWDILIADELHYAKSNKTLRWKYMRRLRSNAKKRIGLTGDPVSNSIFDLYTQLEFLGEGASGFSTFKHFRDFFGVYVKTWNGQNKLESLQNLPFLREQLARKAFLITKQEALPDLPSVTNRIIDVEMSSEQEQVYRQAATQMVAEIDREVSQAEGRGAQHERMTINHILTKLLRLSEICAGYMKTDAIRDENNHVIQKANVRYFKENPKIRVMIEDVLQKREFDVKTIIWSCFVPAIEQISEYLTTYGLGHVTYYGKTSKSEREIAVQQFNSNPLCTVFVGNTRCAGEGLNLLGYNPHDTSKSQVFDACQTIFYCQNFSKTQRTQPEGRNHRIGTRRQVEIIDLVIPGTIDEEIRARVLEKRIAAYQISDVRQILRNLSKML